MKGSCVLNCELVKQQGILWAWSCVTCMEIILSTLVTQTYNKHWCCQALCTILSVGRI